MKSTICGALVAREVTLSLALSTGDPVESGATPATNGPDITAGSCTIHRWKEFKLTYWGVLFLCYIGFFLTTIFHPLIFGGFCVVIEVFLPWLRLATCPKTSATRCVAVDLQLVHPNSSLLIVIIIITSVRSCAGSCKHLLVCLTWFSVILATLLLPIPNKLLKRNNVQIM